MADRIWTKVAAWTGWPLLLIMMSLLFLWPAAEERFLPIRTHQSIEAITRSGDRLCWVWTSIKERRRVSDNLDAFLLAGDNRFVTTVFDPATGAPWNRGQAKPVSPHPQPQPYCTLLPPSVKPDQAVRLTQVAYYPSLIPGMHVLLHLPDVLSMPSGKPL